MTCCNRHRDVLNSFGGKISKTRNGNTAFVRISSLVFSLLTLTDLPLEQDTWHLVPVQIINIDTITKYHTNNKCTNCMSFILNHFFKTLFTDPTYFDSISLIIIREHI